MFFAAIAAGVDLTGGFYSFSLAEKNNLGVLYKDVSIEFKRRVDGPPHSSGKREYSREGCL